MGIETAIALGIVGALGGGFMANQSAQAQKKAAKSQAEMANRAAEENRTNAAKLQADATANAKSLQEATVQAQEDARKENMRRRASSTKTLLSGSMGDTSAADTSKKVLLGA